MTSFQFSTEHKLTHVSSNQEEKNKTKQYVHNVVMSTATDGVMMLTEVGLWHAARCHMHLSLSCSFA